MNNKVQLQKLVLRMLNNAELGAFFVKFIQLLITATIEKLNIAAEKLALLTKYLEDLTDLVLKQSNKEITARLKEYESGRNRQLRYLAGAVRNKLLSRIAAELEAAKKLLPLVKSCNAMTQLPREQKSEHIDAFLLDAEKPEFTGPIAKLGLGPEIDELNRINTEYKALSFSRTAERAADATVPSKILRPMMKELYDEMLAMAYGTYLSNLSAENPSPEIDEFVSGFNQLVTETQTAYNQRMAQRKKGQHQSAKQQSSVAV